MSYDAQNDLRRWMMLCEVEQLDEIEIIQSLATPQPQRFLGGTLLSQESFGDVYQHSFPPNQDVYYIGNQTDVFSYVIVESKSGHLWLLEAFTDPQYRGKNLSPQLIQWVVKKLGRIIIDRQLTPTSARMIERMIDIDMVSASIVDIQAGSVTSYNPDDPVDKAKSIYDVDVPGIDRPRLPQQDKLRYTWMLESAPARRGILSAYVRLIEPSNPTSMRIMRIAHKNISP